MDRIFRHSSLRKRANSRSDGTDRPATLKKTPSNAALNDGLAKKRQVVKEAFEGKGKEKAVPISDKPPSLSVEIRNSLILPGLSQRFSVLLPCISTAPESSIRSLLASQRRKDGPSLTEEEEELLFAEMRKNEYTERSRLEGDQSLKSPEISPFIDTSSPSASTSIKSAFSDSSDPTTASLDTPSPWPVSPPPTSSSFSSFRTFGVQDSSVKVKSYGFSGNAGFRDAEYIRKTKRSASGKDDNGKPDCSDVPKGTAHPHSPSLSDRTATPTTASPPASAASPSSPLAPLSLAQPSRPTTPSQDAPVISPPAKSGAKRMSLLAGLTPAQVKRISMALGEIEGKLYRAPLKPFSGQDDDEETLESLDHSYSMSTRFRSASGSSEASSAFQYKDSPGKINIRDDSMDASPSRLPPSPRSHNLAAHVAPSEPLPPLPRPLFKAAHTGELAREMVPRPTLTPSKTRPVRHNPTSSISPSMGDVSPAPAYVPGQPRPVGSMHRSEGSTSSRAATPTQASPVVKNTSPFLDGESLIETTRTDTAAGVIPLRSSSLGRSQSVNQNTRTHSPGFEPTFGPSHLRAQSLDTTPSRSMPSARGATSTANVIKEEEDELSDEPCLPQIKSVPGRYRVQGNQLHSSQQSTIVSGQGWTLQTPDIPDRVVSHQGMVGSSSDPIDIHGRLRSPPTTLRHFESTNTIASDYVDAGVDPKWNDVLGDTDASVSANDAGAELVADQILRRESGMGWGEMSTLQARLVEKAKMERTALRGSDNMMPEFNMSPLLDRSPNLPAFPSLGHGTTSPSAKDQSRAQSPQTTVSPPSAFAMTFPPALQGKVDAAPLTSSSGVRTSPLPRLGPLATPSQALLDRVIATPTSDNVNVPPRRIAPEDDPNVRRDFEARIAAATAALNRTPSINASLQRKSTKRGGALKISSPTLVSSSASLEGTPLTHGETPIDPGMAKALEKASGSSRKMTMRWRKLGFRRGPSVSAAPDVLSPPDSTQLQTALRLEDPIALRAASSPEAPKFSPVVPSPKISQSQSPDLNAFRFPASAPRPALFTAIEAATMDLAMPVNVNGQGRDRNASGPSTGLSAPPILAEVLHSPSSSTDSAVMKFIEAGRAVGLNDAQLHDMLVAKGMLDQSDHDIGAHMGRSAVRAANPVRKPSQDKKTAKGLFRSLSRKKSQPSKAETPLELSSEPVPRNTIVRRTLLVPSEAPFLAPTTLFNEQASPASPCDQSQRKLSIKRKPLNLTKEDHVLVQNSPSGRVRKVSTATTASALSEEVSRAEETAGLESLQAGATRDRSTSSVNPSEGLSDSGSLYDIYDDYANQENLASPTQSRRVAAIPSPGKRSTHAVEITEYADGKLVWSLVDALRARDDSDEVVFGSPGNLNVDPHSRSTSYSSRPDANGDSGGDVFTPAQGGRNITGLAGHATSLTFRQQRSTVARPPTNVYYTSSTDIGDLIDHLSSDLDASRGRIDILPHTSDRAPSPTDRSSLEPAAGQFEDAPSPRRPPPIRSPRPFDHDEVIPQRQLFTGTGSGRAANMGMESSPSAPSFASSGSGMPGITVEQRLQALLDRLRESGLKE